MRSATVMQGFFRNKENMEGRVSGYWYWLLTLFVLQTILTIVFFLECWFSLLVLLYSLLISCTFTLLSAVSSVERAGGRELGGGSRWHLGWVRGGHRRRGMNFVLWQRAEAAGVRWSSGWHNTLWVCRQHCVYTSLFIHTELVFMGCGTVGKWGESRREVHAQELGSQLGHV